MKYNYFKIEKKWQAVWEKKKPYRARYPSRQKKYYALIEFPYPSGDGLHVGHVRSYTAMDIVARKRRAEGYNVLYPIGWDAFGLPTENFAIKHKVHPKIVTKRNTDTFRRQLKSLGFSFDWEREINTTDPNYYKWTQWIFLKFFEEGLAYKAKTLINWCPNDKIGLANEEVVAGRCERCGFVVEKREKEQWVLKITAYADKLLQGLNTVNYIPEAKVQQEHWIGRSEGALLKFPVAHSERAIEVFTTRPDTLFGATYVVLAPEHDLIEILRPRVANWGEVSEYIEAARSKADEERTSVEREKTGVELKGVKAVNPATREEVPVWISDYVLSTYGTGAIMAVPAHDDRDFSFAKKFGLPVVSVIEPVTGKPHKNEEARKSIVAIVENPATGKLLSINWGERQGGSLFVGAGIGDGEDALQAARREILEETGYKNLTLISRSETAHHHYFAVSKKVYRNIEATGFYFQLQNEEKEKPSLQSDEKGKFQVEWVTKEEAVVRIKDPLHAYVFNSLVKGEVYTGSGILARSGKFTGMDSEKAKKQIVAYAGGREKVEYKLRDWIFSRQRYWGEPIPLVFCAACKESMENSKSPKHKAHSLKLTKGELLNPGWIPVPDRNLPVELPNVKDYMPTDTGESPLANIPRWVAAKCPRCKGQARRETDVMPNWAGSSWYFLRYTDPDNKWAFADVKKIRYFAPVDWYNGGMEHTVLHLLYSRFWNRFLYDKKLVPYPEPYKKRTSHGLIMGEGGVKMSKSKGNVVNPDAVVQAFGADALRLYEMFGGPFNQAVAWDSQGIIGMSRFLERVWTIGKERLAKASLKDDELLHLLHRTVKKVSEDIESMSFNTAVSTLMIFANECARHEAVSLQVWKPFLKLLAPFVPHIAEELWSRAGEKKSIQLEAWPTFNPKLVQEQQFKLVIQINGKVRETADAPAGISQKEAEALAFSKDKIKALVASAVPKKIIFVPGRLINIVL